MGLIYSRFIEARLDLDLRKPAPDGINKQIDADSLLRELETIVGGSVDERVERQTQIETPKAKRSEATTVSQAARKHGRGGGFGMAARNTLKQTVDTSRKAFRTNMNGKHGGNVSSDHSSEHTEISKDAQSTLEFRLNNWRTDNLSGVPFANSRFAEIRSKHLQQATSELDTNGGTT